MPLQDLPSSARDYATTQRGEIAEAVRAIRRQWRRMGTDFESSYRAIEPTVTRITYAAQERVVAGAQEYIPAVLEDTGQTRSLDAFAAVNTRPLIGVAGDGRPTSSLAYGAVVKSRVGVAEGATVYESLRAAEKWLTSAMATMLSDTARASESLASGVRPVTGYVRMLNPPSCSRCALLAGKFYRKNQGFARHPKCDCRHIPSSESLSKDLTVNPRAYFESLNVVDQNRVFTKAGADAIREGGDLSQIVNARRGMSVAQDGRLVTSEGTSRRGFASSRNTGRQGERLMPETIARMSTDRDSYLRLLSLNGYIL